MSLTMRPRLRVILTLILALWSRKRAEAECRTGCRVSLASYYVTEGSTLSYISSIFGHNDTSQILLYNPKVKSQDSISAGDRLRVPFTCDCLNGDFLGHTFQYVTRDGDRYDTVAAAVFANLTTEDWVRRVNTFAPTQIPASVPINVTVNCTCGDARVSRDYGLFATWPLLPAETLSTVAAGEGLPPGLLEQYNPAFLADSTSGIVFVPAKDGEGKYPPLNPSKGVSSGVIGGISIATIVGASLLVGGGLYFKLWRRKKSIATVLLPLASDHHDSSSTSRQGSGLAARASNATGSSGITMDKSVEFSYEELSKATNDFSLDNKIGQGGFGSVYYAELRGEKVAIKKMDMQASKEFLAELKVLTHVHHLNLVRLIGYCVEGSLFLVYEYIENGNLSEHLHGEGFEPLSWTTRVQIALDSARGLEYIHEHTVPVYIHRDIKSANILIDRNYRGKVADFGLTKLTEYGNTSLHTRLVGTFGYMPPEYAQYGDVSAKVDVYAFGVVLYELISAKEAIVKSNESVSGELKGLVALFEEVLVQPDSQDHLVELVDPRLGKNYSIDSVSKMAQLAKACTQESPQLRPSMRSIVVALMTLSTTSEDWDVGSLYENQALASLLTGR